MKKLLIIIVLISSCSYNPAYDSRGLDGKNIAHRYHDDLQTCQSLAEQNTPFYEPLKYVYNWTIRPQMLWLPYKWEYSYKSIIDKCMTNRGHSIITTGGI